MYKAFLENSLEPVAFSGASRGGIRRLLSPQLYQPLYPQHTRCSDVNTYHVRSNEAGETRLGLQRPLRL